MTTAAACPTPCEHPAPERCLYVRRAEPHPETGGAFDVVCRRCMGVIAEGVTPPMPLRWRRRGAAADD